MGLYDVQPSCSRGTATVETFLDEIVPVVLSRSELVLVDADVDPGVAESNLIQTS